MKHVDLNCDIGESTGTYYIEKDLALLEHVSSINLACGFHAGDAPTMHRLVKAALTRNIAIGAHPSFPDRENFGRTEMQLSPGDIYDIVLYQIGALQAFLQINQQRLHHVKPHGALYNMAAASRPVAEAIAHAIYDFDKGLMLYGLSGSELIAAARQIGLQTVSEVFADRTYQADGSLTPRRFSNALIEEKAVALKQVLRMVQEGTVRDTTGKDVPLEAQTICVHGDGRNALEMAKAIYETLREHDISIRKP